MGQRVARKLEPDNSSKTHQWRVSASRINTYSNWDIMDVDRSELERKIDYVMSNSIPLSAPGAVALVSYRNSVPFFRAYGSMEEYHFKFQNDTIFDLASLTKPLATSLLSLKLIDSCKLSLKDTVGELNLLNGFINIQKLTFESLLCHTSGMISDFPLYEKGRTREAYLSQIEREAGHAEMYKKEVYSDLNYILLGFLIEEMYGKPLDVVWQEEIGSKLGLKNSGFNLQAMKDRIPPTEITRERGVIWGDVHDENAYYLGGVAGHAGLFSTAHDIDTILKAMMNGSIISKKTFQLAITNRNGYLGGIFGLGWMTKTQLGSTKSDSFDFSGFFGDYSPYGSAGHTGFTGTSICINTGLDLRCVLLSNRTFPSRGNTKNIRLRRLFHNAVFSSIH